MGHREAVRNCDGMDCGEASKSLKSDVANNGFAIAIGSDVGEGSSGGSEGFRTYKRRKHAKTIFDSKDQECSRAILDIHSQLPVQECLDTIESRQEGPSQLHWKANGSHNTIRSHINVVSNGSVNEPSNRDITAKCQSAFRNVIISEKFDLLCELLCGNFHGVKEHNVFGLKVIDGKMREGTYEHSPMLFSADIQQIWENLQGIGAEIVSLAKSLSEVSRSSYLELVGGPVQSTFGDGKHEESGYHSNPEKTGTCNVYKVCACRKCGEKAEGRDCLVCDSCEEMYHVSCIEPAVKEIPPKNWFCASCTASRIGSPHENCVVCVRLNAPEMQTNGVGDEATVTNEETLKELEENSDCGTEDNLPLCKICGSEVERFEKGVCICGHPFCPHKYYHARCLTPKQLKLYGPTWYCPSCLCRVCLIDQDDEKIILCDGCDHAYHIYCLRPVRTSIPRGKWFCEKCDAGIQEICRVKRAYEKRKPEGSRIHRKIMKELNDGDDEESDKSRAAGIKMLLSAADTLDEEMDQLPFR